MSYTTELLRRTQGKHLVEQVRGAMRQSGVLEERSRPSAALRQAREIRAQPGPACSGEGARSPHAHKSLDS